MEFVLKNPVPEGGFADRQSEMEYARKIHDYIACKVTYSPIGYDPESMSLGCESMRLTRKLTTCWRRSKTRPYVPDMPEDSH